MRTSFIEVYYKYMNESELKKDYPLASKIGFIISVGLTIVVLYMLQNVTVG